MASAKEKQAQYQALEEALRETQMELETETDVSQAAVPSALHSLLSLAYHSLDIMFTD